MPMPLQEEIDRLVRGEHHEPHRVLGAHAEGGRVRVRAWRPDARTVAVVVDGQRQGLEKIHPAGLFEGTLAADSVPRYRLEVSQGERVVTVEDPYRFLPTVGELDQYLFGEGRHERLWERLGAHPMVLDGVAGTAFAVWAPNARSVRVVGDFNNWDGRLHPMRVLGASGIWELFVPGAGPGARYKYEVLGRDGGLVLKADPFAFATERPPATASVVHTSAYRWGDEAWMAARGERQRIDSRISVYEVHLGSWRKGLGYRQLAEELPDYVADLGFTHVELMPLAEHPFEGSWGYQVTSYFAPTARFGGPDDLRFLVASALYWLEEFHLDGLRVDAVASMLYLDYSRKAGQWVPNRFGGNEDLEAIEFIKELNTIVYAKHPNATTVAEESTAWPRVSQPVYLGGLGFVFKWNMGWMHDTLEYISKDPVYRRFHHHQLTFSLMYAFSENFILPISHDEVVHGKGSLYGKMPGDTWRRLANLRAYLGFMWAHPGKQLLFMGCELAQEAEWSHERSIDWEALADPGHAGIQRLVRDLNDVASQRPALWQVDSSPSGFGWIAANDVDDNALSFIRWSADGHPIVCLCNFSPVPRYDYRVGFPQAGHWAEVLNTDSELYGGSNVGNLGMTAAEEITWDGQPASARVTLPPLATVWLAPA